MPAEPNESELQQRLLGLALELANKVEQRADGYADLAAHLRKQAGELREAIERCRRGFSEEAWARVRELIAATCGDLDDEEDG
jgi:hypothetical protein